MRVEYEPQNEYEQVAARPERLSDNRPPPAPGPGRPLYRFACSVAEVARLLGVERQVVQKAVRKKQVDLGSLASVVGYCVRLRPDLFEVTT